MRHVRHRRHRHRERQQLHRHRDRDCPSCGSDNVSDSYNVTVIVRFLRPRQRLQDRGARWRLQLVNVFGFFPVVSVRVEITGDASTFCNDLWPLLATAARVRPRAWHHRTGPTCEQLHNYTHLCIAVHVCLRRASPLSCSLCSCSLCVTQRTRPCTCLLQVRAMCVLACGQRAGARACRGYCVRLVT